MNISTMQGTSRVGPMNGSRVEPADGIKSWLANRKAGAVGRRSVREAKRAGRIIRANERANRAAIRTDQKAAGEKSIGEKFLDIAGNVGMAFTPGGGGTPIESMPIESAQPQQAGLFAGLPSWALPVIVASGAFLIYKSMTGKKGRKK